MVPIRNIFLLNAAWDEQGLSSTASNRSLVPFNRGIATPVCALVRNDVLIVVCNGVVFHAIYHL